MNFTDFDFVTIIFYHHVTLVMDTARTELGFPPAPVGGIPPIKDTRHLLIRLSPFPGLPYLTATKPHFSTINSKSN